ncbi:Ger(x)C family spore germination protein [Paenibacillus sp. HWE-109]|uniref:Ger(x)C family spore germination protein n=1 Tax=Paenibacillus sp. HWE-109 TaxID=1306526 RepID=UPI001EDE132D|nr:Ger(x)C family spore germination protein [Paenibacillus sp. HWE-109]UKS23839.1 Ger(x)C family spore germination protein [Paenibacillus sp. HWE-109]
MSAIIWKWTVICLCIGCLTGCWDKIEVNQLAIAGLVGTDTVPETHEQIVYYQIINPGAFASQMGSNVKSPVYTYKVQGPSKGELGLKSSEILPRRLFTDHYQSHIISERYAREGLRPFLNYYERQYNRRSSLLLLVTDSPLADVMMTYIPLERLQGRTLRSLVNNVSESTGRVSRKSRVKDLVENMETSMITILPLVSLSGSKPSLTTDRYEQINANQKNLILTGGAVFKHDRMVGKMGLKQAGYYNLLKGEASSFFESVEMDGSTVDLAASKVKVHKSLSMVSGKPIWMVTLDIRLSIINNEQMKDLTTDNIAKIKQQFNNQIIEKSTELYLESCEKQWDLFGLENKIKYKRGKEWDYLRNQKNSWTQTKLQIKVNSTVNDIGEIINPYKGE